MATIEILDRDDVREIIDDIFEDRLANVDLSDRVESIVRDMSFDDTIDARIGEFDFSDVDLAQHIDLSDKIDEAVMDAFGYDMSQIADKFHELENSVSDLDTEHSHDDLDSRITDIEEKFNDHEHSDLQAENDALKDRVADLENRLLAVEKVLDRQASTASLIRDLVNSLVGN